MAGKDLSFTRHRAVRQLNRLLLGGEPDKVKDWARQGGDYRQEFFAAAHLLADMEALADDPEILAVANEPLRVRRGGRFAASWPAWAIAALLLIVPLVSVLLWPDGEVADIDLKRYMTRVGEQKTVHLNDGSVMTLNTGTQLLVQITRTERKVILEQGEVYLDVARDSGRPFTVDAGFRSVSVLGTRFNVHKLPDKLQVGVAEGVVAIHSSQEAPSALAPALSNKTAGKNARQYRVEAGWVAEFDVGRQETTGYSVENIQTLYQWRSGVLDFDGTPLVDVVKELNRYSGKKILIEDGSIVDMKVLAVFQIGRIDLALDGLTKTLPLKATYHFDRIVLTRAQ